MTLTLDTPETDEEFPWWDRWDAIVLVAEYLATQGAGPREIISVFQTPWEHTDAWQATLAAGVSYLIGGE